MEAWEVEVLLCPSYEAFEIALVDAADRVLWNVSSSNRNRERAYDIGARAVVFCQVTNIRVQLAYCSRSRDIGATRSLSQVSLLTMNCYLSSTSDIREVEAEREPDYVPPQRFLVNG